MARDSQREPEIAKDNLGQPEITWDSQGQPEIAQNSWRYHEKTREIQILSQKDGGRLIQPTMAQDTKIQPKMTRKSLRQTVPRDSCLQPEIVSYITCYISYLFSVICSLLVANCYSTILIAICYLTSVAFYMLHTNN